MCGDDLAECCGPRDRLQADDDSRSRRRDSIRSAQVAHPGVDPQSEPVALQFAIQSERRFLASDGVEVGDIQFAEAEVMAERTSDVSRLGGGGQLADNR